MSAQLRGYTIDQSSRSREAQSVGPVQGRPQQAIEADKVIDVGVRDEGVAHAPEYPRRQVPQISKIEQHGPRTEAEIDKDPRVGEWVVDESRLDEPSHAPLRSLGLVNVRLIIS